MQYRFIADSGVRTSELCFGTMAFGGDADPDTSAAMYRAARDAGINHFDCADVYNGGASEHILGDLIAGERDQIVLASKAYFPTGDGPNDRGTSRFHLVRAVEASLRRLKTDRIDLFWLHRFDDATGLESTLRACEHLVASGKVLYLGFSNFAAWQVSKALGVQARFGWAPGVAIQPMYNLVKRTAEIEMLPMAQGEGIAVFPYSPLGGGLLSGKYTRGTRPADGRLERWPMYNVRYGDPTYYAAAEDFTALADELGVHPVSLAVRWVATHPAVTAPIIGARTVDQLRPALASVDVDMDAALRDRISALTPAPPPATDRNEETSSHNFGSR